jgi:hypothetical protein
VRDASSTEADRLGVGARCDESADCNFDDEDCPEAPACVTPGKGVPATNYCYRVCREKPECNENRTEENASNCSSNIVFVDDHGERKACVPPSSGL